MITGIDVNETKPYILESDTGDNPTVFHLGVLKKRDFFSLLDGILKEDGEPDIQLIQERAGDIVKKGIKRIENYALNSNEEPMTFQTIDDNVIESLPVHVLVELAMQVITHNFLSREEQKN